MRSCSTNMQAMQFISFFELFWSCIHTLSLQFLFCFSFNLPLLFFLPGVDKWWSSVCDRFRWIVHAIGGKTLKHMGYIISFFTIIIVANKYQVGPYHLLHIIGQVCGICFLYMNFSPKEKLLILVIFFFSIFTLLVLKGVGVLSLIGITLMFLFSLLLLPGDIWTFGIVLSFYFPFGPELAQWGILLAFQLVGIYLISLLSENPTRPLLTALIATALLSFLGIFIYGNHVVHSHFYVSLASYFSGAAIIFIRLYEDRSLELPLFFIFACSAIISISEALVSPNRAPEIFLHVLFFFGIYIIFISEYYEHIQKKHLEMAKGTKEQDRGSEKNNQLKIKSSRLR